MVNSLHRKIICAYRDYEMLKRRYPHREVYPDIFALDGFMSVGRKEGVFLVKIEDGSVWIPGEWPHFAKRFRGTGPLRA